jgi:hypothetical protein
VVNQKAIPIVISVIAGTLFLLHMAIPRLAIDAVALSLLLLAVLPWLIPYIKSVELPGGTKIELRDLEKAAEKIISLDGDAEFSEAQPEILEFVSDLGSDTFETLRSVATRDANLAVVGFRIEIEGRIRALAKQHDISDNRRTLRSLVAELRQKHVLPRAVAAGLAEIVDIGNRAAHGALIPPEAADWVVESGPSIIYELDRIAAGRKR